jgi:DcmR-like sensory protein
MAPSTHHHAVQFYRDSDSLCRTVAEFIGEGIGSGQPALVVATEAHRDRILSHLSKAAIDVHLARKSGDLVILDAQEMLDLFMMNGMPDVGLFEGNVGRFIEQALTDRPRQTLYVYGEMVDVLWKDGAADAAIKLEILWNRLAARYPFSLLCGYAMGEFFKHADRLDDVCAQHTVVMPAHAPTRRNAATAQ